MSQLGLAFGRVPRHPRARRTDASSSHEAAAHLESSGLGQRQAEEVLAALRRFPGSTSAELARASGIARAVIARRLPELESVCKVRDCGKDGETRLVSDVRCTVSGSRCVRWWPR